MCRFKCANCEFETDDDEDFKHWNEIHHLGERLDIGGTVPAGECPECGCLVYLHENSKESPDGRTKFIVDSFCEETDELFTDVIFSKTAEEAENTIRTVRPYASGIEVNSIADLRTRLDDLERMTAEQSDAWIASLQKEAGV